MVVGIVLWTTPSTAGDLPAPVRVDSLLTAADGDTVLALSQAIIIYRGRLAKEMFRSAEKDSVHAATMMETSGLHVRELERRDQKHAIDIEQKDWEIDALRGSWLDRTWEKFDQIVYAFVVALIMRD